MDESDSGHLERMMSLSYKILRSRDYPRHCFCEQTNPNLAAEDKYPQPKSTTFFDETIAQIILDIDYKRLNALIANIFSHPLTLSLSFLRQSTSSKSYDVFCDFTHEDFATITHVFDRLSFFDRFAADISEGCEEATDITQSASVATAYSALHEALRKSAVFTKEKYAYLAVRFFMICLATPAGQNFDADFIVNIGSAINLMNYDTKLAVGRTCSKVFGYDYVRRAAVKLTDDSSRWASFKSSVLLSMKMIDGNDDDDDEDNNESENDESDDEGKKFESRLRKCGYKPWSDDKITSLYKFVDILYNENDRLTAILSNDTKRKVNNSVPGDGNESRFFVKDSEWYNVGISSSEDLYNDYKRFREGKSSFLGNHPYAIRLKEKTRLIRLDSRRHQERALLRNVNLLSFLLYGIRSLYTNITVRRTHLIKDSLKQLEDHKPEDLTKELHITFEGEDGVDAGGVRKEWFQLLISSVIDPRYGMFSLNEHTRTFWFMGNSDTLNEFCLIGKIVALAVYNGVILDLHFPHTLYKKLKNRPVSFSDLRDVHPDIYNSLRSLLAMDPDDVPDLDLTFSVMENAFGCSVEKELCPGGSKVGVDGNNREEYVRLYTKYLLVDSVARQFNAFKSGFDTLASLSKLFQLLSPGELELAICGNPVLDWDELEANTHYREGYSKETPIIKAFWKTFRELSEDDKKTFLKFTTGSDRCPVGGLKDINLVIMRNGGDQDALPTSKTCFNILLLPEYDSEEKFRKKFLTAIQCSTGFGLK